MKKMLRACIGCGCCCYGSRSCQITKHSAFIFIIKMSNPSGWGSHRHRAGRGVYLRQELRGRVSQPAPLQPSRAGSQLLVATSNPWRSGIVTSNMIPPLLSGKQHATQCFAHARKLKLFCCCGCMQIAMANDNTPNSNGSQFFISLDSCEWLKNKHTIFGTMRDLRVQHTKHTKNTKNTKNTGTLRPHR